MDPVDAPRGRGIPLAERDEEIQILSQAVEALAYYAPENNPTLYHEAERWLELVLSEREEPR